MGISPLRQSNRVKPDDTGFLRDMPELSHGGKNTRVPEKTHTPPQGPPDSRTERRGAVSKRCPFFQYGMRPAQ